VATIFSVESQLNADKNHGRVASEADRPGAPIRRDSPKVTESTFAWTAPVPGSVSEAEFPVRQCSPKTPNEAFAELTRGVAGGITLA
jgi:hypothetical protein